jgi:hypothetical protein
VIHGIVGELLGETIGIVDVILFISLVLINISGGESGIRTHDRVAPIHAFQACAFDRSATSPWRRTL